MADIIPYYEPAERLTGEATAAITAGRFLIVSGDLLSGPDIPATAQIGASDPVDGGNIQVAHAAANGPAIGVSLADAADGDKVMILCVGVVPMTADGAISAGDEIMVGSTGKPKTYAAPTLSGNSEALPEVVKVGIALNDAISGGTAMIKLQGLQ